MHLKESLVRGLHGIGTALGLGTLRRRRISEYLPGDVVDPAAKRQKVIGDLGAPISADTIHLQNLEWINDAEHQELDRKVSLVTDKLKSLLYAANRPEQQSTEHGSTDGIERVLSASFQSALDSYGTVSAFSRSAAVSQKLLHLVYSQEFFHGLRKSYPNPGSASGYQIHNEEVADLKIASQLLASLADDLVTIRDEAGDACISKEFIWQVISDLEALEARRPIPNFIRATSSSLVRRIGTQLSGPESLLSDTIKSSPPGAWHSTFNDGLSLTASPLGRGKPNSPSGSATSISNEISYGNGATSVLISDSLAVARRNATRRLGNSFRSSQLSGPISRATKSRKRLQSSRALKPLRPDGPGTEHEKGAFGGTRLPARRDLSKYSSIIHSHRKSDSVFRDRSPPLLPLSLKKLDDFNDRNARFQLELEEARALDRAEEEERLRKEEEERLRKAGGLRRPKQRLVSELSDSWTEKATATLRASPTEVLAVAPQNVSLRKHDFSKVVPATEWLNDEIVNGSLGFVDEYVNKAAGVKDVKTQTRRCLVLGSFFYEHIRKTNGQNTERMLRRNGVTEKNFMAIDTILVPICESSHWTLVVVRPSKRSIAHMDSLNPRGSLAKTNLFMAWVKSFLKNDFKADEWQVTTHQAPSQTNGWDCGVHTITNGMCLALGINPMDAYTSDEMPLQRLRLAAMLLNGGFTGDFSLGTV